MRTQFVALVLLVASAAHADYGCSSASYGWRGGRLGLANGNPIVSDRAFKVNIYRPESDSWANVSSTVFVNPEPAQPLEYSADQWKQPEEVELSSGGPRVSIRQLAKDISGDGYNNRWSPEEQFVLTVDDRVSTVTLKGVWGFRSVVKHPTNKNLLYVLTQEPIGEDSPCGNGDGPGLLRIDLKSGRPELIFPTDKHGGIWEIQFVKGRIWMLTSSGVCVGPENGGARTCWSYHSAKVTRPGGAEAFLQNGMGTKPAVSLPPIVGPSIKIIGGKENREGIGLHYQVEHPAAKDGMGVYVKSADVEPELGKD